jgi:hypothetical protein
METFLGLAGAGVGMLILFVLYLGGAAVALKLVAALRGRKSGTN